MAQAGLVGRCRRKKTRTTFSDPEARALDLVKRAFGPGTELDRTWVGDITYVRTWEGWLYLASVIDLASRRVVGWAMAEHMRAELACDALSMGLAGALDRELWSKGIRVSTICPAAVDTDTARGKDVTEV